MNCLCCGKPISENASAEELRMSWHSSCVRSFFGTRTLPFIDLSEELLEKLAEQSVNRGLTVPGVQKKISLHLTQGDQPRLTLIDYPAGYILKPQTEEYEQLPEAEYLTMRMAERCGISVVPFAMITLGKPEQNAYITKRIDRRIQPASKRPVQKFAMEISASLTTDHHSINTAVHMKDAERSSSITPAGKASTSANFSRGSCSRLLSGIQICT